MRQLLGVPLLPLVASAPLPAAEAPSGPSSAGDYRAVGQEPGWRLTIGPERLDYVGDDGEVRVAVPIVEWRASFNGWRYVGRGTVAGQERRLDVDVTVTPCADAMSGRRYKDTVSVTVDPGTSAERTVEGCGGEL